MTAKSARRDGDAFTFVLFGATGDLAMRKIIPALYAAHRNALLSDSGKIVCVAPTSLDSDGYLRWIDEQVMSNVAHDSVTWRSFQERVTYLSVDATKADGCGELASVLKSTPSQRIFYLATAPSLFVPICVALADAQLQRRARVVLEKPLGHDLDSSVMINDAIGRIFAEDQIYRIDHYLGKESVQNLLALRFGNSLFEPLWRREWVHDVQITVAEELGVESRGHFYDRTGALRDMVQNHLLQLLAIVAMEPPRSMDSDAVRDEKLRVLRALKPMSANTVARSAVRGQYRGGAVRGGVALAYRDEQDVSQDSATETYVAVRAEIENWRWAGVPFFLRTGKRLAAHVAEIIVNFKPVPHSALGTGASPTGSNRLTIRLQPSESIRLDALAKKPGMGMTLQGVSLDLAFDQFFSEARMEAYERLLLDVIAGRLALFVRRDEQEAAWTWVAPIIELWRKTGDTPKPYVAGSWGPAAASALLARDGTCWPEEDPEQMVSTGAGRVIEKWTGELNRAEMQQ